MQQMEAAFVIMRDGGNAPAAAYYENATVKGLGLFQSGAQPLIGWSCQHSARAFSGLKSGLGCGAGCEIRSAGAQGIEQQSGEFAPADLPGRRRGELVTA